MASNPAPSTPAPRPPRRAPACAPVPVIFVSIAFASGALRVVPAPADAPDRRPDPGRLTVATFNARFLFDGRAPEGQAAFPWKGDPALARRHLRDIALVVRSLDADLVHLSEVEDLDTLNRLRLEVGDPAYRAHLVPGRDDFTRQNVALLSRVDLDEPLSRTDETEPVAGDGSRQGVSKNYAARVTVNGLPLTFIGLHLLAFPDDPERRAAREAQAEVIRRLAARETREERRLVFIVGDLNDYDEEVPDAAGNVPISRVLEILRRDEREGAEDDRANAARWLSAAERFTAWVDRDQDGDDDGLPERALTDHVLFPRALVAAVQAVEVLADHEPPEPSDHFPLKLSLDLEGLSLFVRGDLDGDRRRTDADALSLLRHLFEDLALPCRDAADADDDGTVSVTDAVVILNAIHLGGPELPPPGPRTPGDDPTPDRLACGG